MKNLQRLIDRFKPRRAYKHGDISFEVDGAFLRVDDGLIEQAGQEILKVPLEDFLQDPAIIRSARVSTGRDTKEVDEKATGLLNALYRGRHETPSEGGVMFRLRVTCPIYLAQPFFQLPGSHNEFSGRYSVIDGDFAAPEYIRADEKLLAHYQVAENHSRDFYEQLLGLGVAREQARFALLYRFFTKFYWTISLRHILEILALEENDLSSFEFWQTVKPLLRSILSDWTPWTSQVSEETPRLVKAQWHKNFASKDMSEKIAHLKHEAYESEQVKNIGEIHMLGFYGDDALLRVACQTKPNPRKGFRHASMSFLETVPIFVHRQWVRHRDGAWSELPVDFDEVVRKRNFYVPLQFREQLGKVMHYQFQDMDKKKNDLARGLLYKLIGISCETYQELRGLGLEPEVAAQNLPYLFRINTLWTPNLESLFNYFSLRCDTHAQWETRQYANVVYKWFKGIYPETNEIFLNHLNFGQAELFGNLEKQEA